MSSPIATSPARIALAAGVCLALASPALARGADPDDLPITGITLYRSGVGSFVRQGRVEDDADVHLRFRTDQINDILKSMVVLDLDGGRIESATYGSKEPLSRRLASFAVDISDNPSRADLLDRLRGAQVEVRTSEGVHAGAVLGVERHETVSPDGLSQMRETLSIVTDQGIWSSGLDDVLSFRLLDPSLAAELTKALAALAEHRTDNVKTLDVGFRGQGDRRVVIGYVQEAPVWKTSYRLVLPKKDAESLTLQGWAIVENTTEEDWENVRLSLVAGQPVSFTMDLYEPLFVERPEVPVPTAAGALPRSYAGGEDATVANAPRKLLEKSKDSSRDRGGAPAAAPSARFGAVTERAEFGGSLTESMGRSVAAAATGQDVGEVFQFSLDTPVTVGRQQSAMLPIIAGPVKGRRVSIFNASDGLTHPMRGLELTNDTGLQLMPGPIAVFDDEAYAGDAQIDHVSRGDKRMLAYAVDLDTDARAEADGSTTIQKVRIVRGLLERQTLDRNRVRYSFESHDQFRDRTLILEQQRLGGWELVDSPKPTEIAGDLYRFEISLPHGERAGVTITQQRTRSETFELLGFDANALAQYTRGGKASAKVVDAFRQAQALQAKVFDSQRTLAELDKERTTIAADQSRIRDNMGSVDRNSDLYSRYVQKLGQQETRLEEIAEAVAEANTELNTRQQALNEYLASLNVD
ncbi:MAG: DUF4139 domain-containing protein [Phycisphaerales bacterium]|nr:DUF4139 domain-containing protein [Phycisphaerales bacterium]